jgi:hypothetical protein
MQDGPSLKGNIPNLLQLKRTLDPADPLLKILPTAGDSKFLSKENFFFLGGAPFIFKIQEENNSTFTAPNGNPETRYQSQISENANYFLNSIYNYKNIPTDITFGPPLRSYEMGPQEVSGIGTLIHNFKQRIPAIFLTEYGTVPAEIISVTVKIVPEQLGCVSDLPLIAFACSENMDEKKILGIYIPLNADKLASCKINRSDNSLWTADLNNDNIPDIACVSSTFTGISSDSLYEALWFVNINGTWKIIDWAQDLDCT